jgi:putative ABC transport system permease protein
MNALRRGIKNAFRNATRTVGIVVILGVAIALSIAMLIARDAVTAKINAVRATTGTSVTVSPAGFFGFAGGGTPLTQSKVNALLQLPHVVALQESLSEELSSSQTSLKSPTPAGFLGHKFGQGGSSGQSPFGGGSFHFVLPVRLIGTNTPGTAVTGGANGGGTETLVAGSAFSPTSTKDVAVIGKTMASTNKLKVGSTFTVLGAKTTVVGIYSSGSTFADSEVLMPLTTVQTLAKTANQVTGATLTVDNIGNVSSVTTAAQKALGSGASVTSTQQAVQSQLSPLNTIETISTYTLFGAIAAAAIILLLSMLMIVRERRREIGVLKAIGATNGSIVRQFIAESGTFTLLGAIVGLLAGVAISNPITSALVSATSSSTSTGFVRHFGGGGGGFGGGGNGFTPPPGGFGGGGGFGFRFHGLGNTITQLHTTVGWATLGFALAAAFLIAALGSTVAASTVIRISPAEVLRSE